MTRLIDCRCTSCGRADIRFDASAEWDVEQQDFVVSNIYDECCCNSEDCQGEERRVAEVDAHTGAALGRGPGSFDYIPKADADAAWADYHEERRAEREARARARQQDRIISDNAAILAAAYQEIVA